MFTHVIANLTTTSVMPVGDEADSRAWSVTPVPSGTKSRLPRLARRGYVARAGHTGAW